MDATGSIHYRRRWFYVLWGVLLLASLGALALWETPKLTGTAQFTLQLQVQNLPARTQVKVWAGPRGGWPGSAWRDQGVAAEVRIVAESVTLVALPLLVAYRRWVKDTIPRRTADLVVLRFEAPGQPPRYFAQPLVGDWLSGILRPGRRMTLRTERRWQDLGTDPAGFSALE